LYYSELFPKTIEFIINKEGKRSKEYLTHLPLVWKIEPNIIEKAYIEWLSSEREGFFLVTWPWPEVRFIPLLISEYLLNYPQKRAIVIGNYSINKEENIELSPSSPHAFTNMIYTTNAEPVNPEIKKERNNLGKQLIIDKEKVVEIAYKKIGLHEMRTELSYKTLRKSKNDILKEGSEFGEGFLRKITEHSLSGKSKAQVVDKNGLWDVSLKEQKRWSGDLHYKKIWLWEVLTNANRLHSCKTEIPHIFDKNKTSNKSGNNDSRLHFLSTEPDIASVLETVTEISPDILVIENTDEIISDSRFGGEISKKFLDFLTGSSEKMILMFSTNPDIRQFYRLNSKDSLFNSIEVIFHTWDSPHIFNSLSDKSGSRHPNPISSNISHLLKEKTRKIIPEYVVVDSYSILIEALNESLSNLEGDIRKDLTFYFKRMTSTPLDIKGDYQRSEVLKVYKLGSASLTYDIVMSQLYELLDPKNFSSLNNILQNVFQMDSLEQVNPLRDEVISAIENILDSDENWYITIVVYPSEIKGTERLLRRNNSITDTALPHMHCCAWKDLACIEGIIPKGFKHCVISTCYPSIDYSLHSSDVDKFIFIGNENGIGKIKDIIETRLLETNAYPVIEPNTAECPYLLNDLFSKADIPDTGHLSEMYEDVINEREYIIPYSEIHDSSMLPHMSAESKTYLKIKPGEPAILCIDSQNRGVFLPFNCSILIKDGTRPYDVTFEDKSSLNLIKKELIGKEIILGRAGFYRSFKSIFFEFMIKFETKVKFQRGPFEWHGFRSLFNDSVHWNRILEKAVVEYAEKNSLGLQQSQNYIAKEIADSGITAIHPEYIIGWWTNYEEINIDSGTYRLYKVEHPFSRNDMQKIYTVIKDLCPEIVIDVQDADRSYAAAISLQNFRRNSLKGHNIDPVYSNVYSQFEKQIVQIMKSSELFQVRDIHKIIVSCEVEPLRIFEDYQNFI
jgi:hypothetical protein